MEELSGFAALPVRSLIAPYELDAAVTTLTGMPASMLPQGRTRSAAGSAAYTASAPTAGS
jgi:hypothetical protein